tara:strand:+ start:307 stop:651 length:345 start_codon:yes stop_codon:yes gene_type:complete
MKIIEKPWGKEEILQINSKYMVKRLTMYKGHRCSLQYHLKKIETIFVLKGKLNILSGKDKDSLESVIYKDGQFITLFPGDIHRMEAIEDCIYLEASTPEIDDVVRIKDDYNRVN